MTAYYLAFEAKARCLAWRFRKQIDRGLSQRIAIWGAGMEDEILALFEEGED